jgi:type III restriction enzyme
LGEKDWAPVRERLFAVDKHATPRVVVSVLMLREGFDVNNICVIVPLRSSQAPILLEQTIGRGLRLMWRDDEYSDTKRENRALLKKGQKPSSMIDVLSIVEHPAFASFYDDLIAEGLAGVDDGDDDTTGGAGDMIKVGLRADFADYGFHMPFIVSEAEEWTTHQPIALAQLPAFTLMPLLTLKEMLGSGDQFVSHDLLTTTMFGDYRVDGAVMNVGGYNDYLSRMGRRIAQALQAPLPKGNKISAHIPHPYMHMSSSEMIATLDEYVRFHLFATDFDPMQAENWRVLLLQPVIDHVVEKFALALHQSEQQSTVGVSEVFFRSLSEVPALVMRESYSLDAPKCIYERLGYPSNSGGLEKAFIEWAQKDSGVDAYCKISENRHTFVRLRYLKHDGLPAFYSPDFLVRAGEVVYVVETKAQAQVSHPNVQRKRQAALNWCNRINALPLDVRQGLTWHYVLLGEDTFYDARDKGNTLVRLLAFARLQELSNPVQKSELF